jgi:hypothetical protein
MAYGRAITTATRFGMTALIAAALSLSQPNRLQAAPEKPDVVVTTTSELATALAPANAGKQILVRAGEYEVSQALVVPDGATLVGEGVMSFDEAGLPTGFEPASRTLIRSTPALVGDILTLGDESTLQALSVEDVAGRAGNPVAVLSRAAGDFISARIETCEIINPNPSGVTPQGQPAGRAIVVMTRNPVVEPAHEGAVLLVQMTQSIIRSPGAGVGVFAINFAAHTQIRLDLEGNVAGGGLSCSGGVGRPDDVTGAGLVIQSSRNLYRSDSAIPTAIGWQLFGGADSPGVVVSQASTFNSLQMHSIDDTLAGFATGIAAAGGRRFSALSGTISSNRVELNLHGTHLQTTTTDWRLFGALSLVNVTTGDDNTAHVLVRQATGSGPRVNLYANSSAPTPGALGVGNRLEIVGNASAFDRTNNDFVPPPPAEFFTAER